MPYNDDNEKSTFMGVRLINNTSAAVTVNCTAVNGIAHGTVTPVSSVKTATVSANSFTNVTWIPGDFTAGAIVIISPNVSCQLPPGAGIGYVYHIYPRQIGT